MRRWDYGLAVLWMWLGFITALDAAVGAHVKLRGLEVMIGLSFFAAGIFAFMRARYRHGSR